jgi:hypothetical protein
LPNLPDLALDRSIDRYQAPLPHAWQLMMQQRLHWRLRCPMQESANSKRPRRFHKSGFCTHWHIRRVPMCQEDLVLPRVPVRIHEPGPLLARHQLRTMIVSMLRLQQPQFLSLLRTVKQLQQQLAEQIGAASNAAPRGIPFKIPTSSA